MLVLHILKSLNWKMGNYSPTKCVWSGEQLGEWND